jgi:hypothetical protein
VSPTRTRGGDERWRAKLYPVFFELAELNREFETRFEELQRKVKEQLSSLGSNTSPEFRKEIEQRYYTGLADLDRWYVERLVAINQQYTPVPYNPLAFNYLTLDEPISDQQGIGEYIHFHRHGESLPFTAGNESSGDLAAHDKIARTDRDLFQIMHGKGPIKPFQQNLIHRQLLQIVIAFEKEPLTAEELAECFDHFCACGKDHDADGLRKMRNRFEAELRKKPAEPL